VVPAGDHAVLQGKQVCEGEFIGLGRKLDLHDITCPAYLLAGAGDDITSPKQGLDAATCLGAPSDHIVQKTVPGGHIGLLIRARTLQEHWPPFARWIAAQKH
jgi:poly(3-hydroxyalkanoate) synthetase